MAKMAKTELSAFKTLGYHQNIVRFFEEFYDKHESIHRKIMILWSLRFPVVIYADRPLAV